MHVRAEQESPIDRAAQSATVAVDDLRSAVFQAKTTGELGVLRELMMELIARLESTHRLAMTLDAQWTEMRGRR